ncbi:MAG: tetratricopeptide repeat protein [Ardenticatenaceae bacterium]|nr:tetratricopeptide repeat protein [Ardenticatenaceae bacterium]
MRYEDIGEIELAIEAYSKALTAWQPSAMIYFERGKLYYQMQKLREAKQDFEQALAYTREDGLRPQEQEEAKIFLSRLTEN